jgi:UDP-glucose 4-epimerase
MMKEKTRKYLLTGCAGLIGSHLADELIKNAKVVGIDNFSLGRKENIKHLHSNKNFTFHQCDILHPEEFENIFRIHSFDAVFHLAANSDISNPDPKKDFQNTLSTTLVVLEKCRIRGIKELVFTSSGAVYGETLKEVNENDCGLPISHYAACKIASEAFISSYSSMYGIQSWICRLPNVVGGRATHGSIFDFNNQVKAGVKELRVLGDGTQTKPFMYVTDLVDAMLFIWKNAKEKINVYNISGIGESSVKFIAEQFGLPIKYTGGDRGWVGDSPKYKCDISRLKELGWSPKRTSDNAIKLTIKKI